MNDNENIDSIVDEIVKTILEFNSLRNKENLPLNENLVKFNPNNIEFKKMLKVMLSENNITKI